jgi:small subunit ribosomal protein S1
MSAHHVDLPEQVVTPGEELWVKIIDLDLDRRRISLSIKQAAEGGIVAAEYQEHFGEQNYDSEGNYIGAPPIEGVVEGEGSTEGQEAWEQYYAEQGFDAEGNPVAGTADVAGADEPAAEEAVVEVADAEGAVAAAAEEDGSV